MSMSGSYEDVNWEGKRLLKFEGERRLLELWNICMKVGMVTDDENIRAEAMREAKGVLEAGPKMGFYQMSEEMYETFRNELTKNGI